MPMLPTAIEHDPIKDYSSRSPSSQPVLDLLRPGTTRLWVYPSWVAYIIITAKPPKRLRPQADTNAEPLLQAASWHLVRTPLRPGVSEYVFSGSLSKENK
jgi:hypothetical protein